MDDLHRIALTEKHYNLARQYMVTNRLRSARIAVQEMIELVAERGVEVTTTEKGAGLSKENDNDRGRRNGHL